MIEAGMYLVFVIMVIVGMAIYTSDKGKTCPVCRDDLTDVGFDGWKKKCESCGWNNYER